MLATIKATEAAQSIPNPSMLSNRKENHFHSQLSVIDAINGEELVCARFYKTDATDYCCVWLRSVAHLNYAAGHPYLSICGGGRARGYGYHRASAAFENACEYMGISFDEGISGRGEGAVESACRAIAKAMTYDDVFIVHAHA